MFGGLVRWHPLGRSYWQQKDLRKGKKMFEGLVSRQERNQLLDELCGDLDNFAPQSMGNKLDSFVFETDVPSGNGNAASSPDQEAA